jgi:hypothetical protein
MTPRLDATETMETHNRFLESLHLDSSLVFLGDPNNGCRAALDGSLRLQTPVVRAVASDNPLELNSTNLALSM